MKIELTRTLPNSAFFAELGVQMQRLHVHRKRRDQQVIGLGDRAAGLMLKGLADFEFFEILAHRVEASQRKVREIFGPCRRAWAPRIIVQRRARNQPRTSPPLRPAPKTIASERSTRNRQTATSA